MSYFFQRNLKLVLYVALLLCFIIFYCYDEVDKFLKGSTTFTQTFAKVESLPLPSIIFCMPGTKSYAKHTFGYHSTVDMIYDKDEKYKKFNLTPSEMTEELAFVLSKDFELSFGIYLGNSYPLTTGLNKVKDREILVKSLWTITGLCYLIEPLFKLGSHESPWFVLNAKPKESYWTDQDFNQEIQIFFASNNTWEGIYLASWMHIDVPKVSIPFDASRETLAEVRPSQVLFRDGITDVGKCFKDIVMTINCSRICSTPIFNYMDKLPFCPTYEEMYCMVDNGVFYPEIEAALAECLRPANTMVFKAKVISFRSSKSDGINMWFKTSTGELEINEEVLSIGLTTFIGSIGGSLGLFLGFSMYDYISSTLDSILKKTKFK